jgi:NADH:ubiquinone oxidoreductase subunit 6 (subunit J)
MTGPMVLCLICLAAMLVCVVAAVMVRSTFKSAIALAGASVLLGILMYALGSAWAALFEISVCSGFVTVIFISAVTMTSHSQQEQDDIYGQGKNTRLLPVLMIVAGFAIILTMMFGKFRLPYPASAPVQTGFRIEFWTEHKDLLLALLTALLAGTFAVVVLFKEEEPKQ